MSRVKILHWLQSGCSTAALWCLFLNIGLGLQRDFDLKRVTVIESFLKTEREEGRLAPVTAGAIDDQLRQIKYPSLHGHWFVRNLSFITSGLFMGSVLASLLARRISSSPSNDLDEPVFRKEALPDLSSGSSLKTETLKTNKLA